MVEHLGVTPQSFGGRCRVKYLALSVPYLLFIDHKKSPLHKTCKGFVAEGGINNIGYPVISDLL